MANCDNFSLCLPQAAPKWLIRMTAAFGYFLVVWTSTLRFLVWADFQGLVIMLGDASVVSPLTLITACKRVVSMSMSDGARRRRNCVTVANARGNLQERESQMGEFWQPMANFIVRFST